LLVPLDIFTLRLFWARLGAMIRLHCTHPEQPEPKVFELPKSVAENIRRRMEAAGWYVRSEAME
jgi:hypothetical protein